MEKYRKSQAFYGALIRGGRRRMKVFVYSYRDFDEGEIFTRYSNEYDIELGICRDARL